MYITVSEAKSWSILRDATRFLLQLKLIGKLLKVAQALRREGETERASLYLVVLSYNVSFSVLALFKVRKFIRFWETLSEVFSTNNIY